MSNGDYDTSIVVQNTFSGQEFSLQLNTTVNTLIFDPKIHIISDSNIIRGNLLECEDFDILIYPVPAGKEISVSVCGDALYNLQIYDINGRLVLNSTIKQFDTFDISQLTSGVYIVSVFETTGQLKRVKKLW